MRNSMPLRWIEQTEAMQVLDAARFEGKPLPLRTQGRAVTARLWQLRDRLCAAMPTGLPMPQVQPVAVRVSRTAPGSRRAVDCDEQEWFANYR